MQKPVLVKFLGVMFPTTGADVTLLNQAVTKTISDPLHCDRIVRLDGEEVMVNAVRSGNRVAGVVYQAHDMEPVPPNAFYLVGNDLGQGPYILVTIKRMLVVNR